MRRIANIVEPDCQFGSLVLRVRVFAACLAVCISCLWTDSTVFAQLRNSQLRNRIAGAAGDAVAYPRCRIRSQDQVWLVCTRHLPFEGNGCDCLGGGAPDLEYYRYDGRGNWISSSADAFFGSQDPRLVTTVYVHGNRVSHDWAKDHGFTVYCRLTQCGCDTRPIRHVIWSWPSDPIPCGARVVKDARVKSCRTTSQSYYLGWWLAQMSSEQRVSLMGFSYGGRTILGALHLVGGGSFAGCSLPGNCANRVRPRVAIWASASEASWICPGGSHERALTQMDRGLIIFNPNDPALRRYQRVVPGAQGPALGSVGIPNCACANGKLWQINAGRAVGKVHQFRPYMDVNYFVSQIRDYALWPGSSVGHFAAQSDFPLPPLVAAQETDSSETPVSELTIFDLAAEYRDAQKMKLIDDAENIDVQTLPVFRLGLTEEEEEDAYAVSAETVETATVDTELR